jgi:hypothetical protein
MSGILLAVGGLIIGWFEHTFIRDPIARSLRGIFPSSFAFRYSTDKKGRPIPLNAWVDLRTFAT